jgi:peptidoglycan hydrolase-like protein with peptidoglycan-binding domain
MIVRQQQLLLSFLDYDVGTIDGITGPKTQAAIRKFQSDYGLSATGIWNTQTENKIREVIGNPEMEKKDATVATGDAFWNGIKYFTKDEFRCPCGKCGGFPVEPNHKLVLLVEEMRKSFGRPIIIVPPDGHSGGSGVRCAAYNATLSGSASNSRHLQGKAVDFSSPGTPAATIEAYLTKLKNTGKIRYWYRISTGSYHMDVN